MADDGSIVGFKGGEKQRTPIEAPDSLYSTSIARILDLLSEGDIEMWVSDNPLKDVFLDGTPVMNADNSLNFQSVQIDWRPGSPDQEYIPGFPSVKSEIAVGVEVKQATPWTRAINNTQLTAISLRLATPALTKTNNENGDTNGHRIDYAFDLSVDGGAFEEVFRGAMAGKTKSIYERGHRIDLPPAATGWQVRVRRISPDSNTQYIQDKLNVQAITEIIDAKLRYPYSAVVGIALDAQQFRSIPQRAYRVKGRVIRIPTNYNPITRAYTGVWDGTFKLGWTNNPAWIYYDMATNKRYGLGRRIAESRIDKWSLYKIAQYCDELVPDGKGGMEPRFTCTVYLQQKADAYKVMQDLASVFRGISYWAGGAIVGLADQPEDPVYTYTNANVKDGKFTYNGTGKKARHTMAMVSWTNLDNFGKGEVVPVIDEEGIIRYGIQPTQVTAFGATSESQAQRVGRWILASELLETDACQWAVGLDGTLVAPGKIVNVIDSDRSGRRLGGRISAVGADWVQVDALPDVLPVAGDTLITITPQGAAQENIVLSVDAGLKRITVTAAFAAMPVAHSVWGLETATVAPQMMRILGITDNGDGSYGIAALQHEPGKFAQVENGVKVEPKPISVLPSTVMLAPGAVTLTATERAGEVLASTVVNADWQAVAGASAYYIQWKRGDGEWSPPEKLVGTNADLENTFPGDHWARVWAINQAGISSPFTMSNKLTVADQSLKPGFVDALNASIANALETAENAQAAADGTIESFWQPTPPVIGTGAGQAKEGDIWFDTDNGNKIHRVVSGSWAVAADDDMAQAIAAATTAQATADGKVKTFFQGSPAPVASAIGDLWFNTDTGVKKLYRWNGITWNNEIADVTLDQLGGSGVNVVPDRYSYYDSATLPPGLNGGNATLSMAAGFGQVSPNSLRVTAGGAVAYAYFDYAGATAAEFPIIPGKKYLISAWVLCGVAIPAGDVHMYLRGKPSDAAVASVANAGQVLAPNVFHRVSAIVDSTGLADVRGTAFVLFNNVVAGRDYYVDGLMVEELIGRKNEPSAYTRGSAAGMALSAIFAAANAQATADGNIDIYFQANPPATAKTGDYWQDSDDKRWYVWQGSWVESTDNRLPQAVTDVAAANAAANNAQATANTKIRLFYQEAQPTATTNGDQWYQPSTKLTRYWNGSGWSLLAEQASSMTNDAIINPKFDAGFTGWDSQGGWQAQAGGGFGNTPRAVIFGAAGNQALRLINQAKFQVRPGARLGLYATVARNQVAADNSLWLGVFFYKSNGDWNGNADAEVTQAEATPGYVYVRKYVNVPADTAYCLFNVMANPGDGGAWGVDNVHMKQLDDNTDTAAGVGKNLIPNSILGGRTAGASPWAIGYNPAGAAVTFRTARDIWWNQAYKFAGGGNVEVRYYNETGSSVTDYVCDRVIRVVGGKRYELSAYFATYRCNTHLIVYWTDVNGNYLSEAAAFGMFPSNGGGYPAQLSNYARHGGFLNAPANAVGCKVVLRKERTYAGEADSYVFMAQPFFGEAGPNQVDLSPWSEGPVDSTDNLSNGTNTGTTAIEDLTSDGVSPWNRIGLRVRGSRQILGGARNARSSLVAGVSSVRTATALSADSAGNVTVNAHVLELNGESVSYSAVTNAVTGLSQNVTYVIFTVDPYLDGGARTYYAQTSVLSAQQAGDGCVFIGNVTIPTSGSAGGGDGGGGNPGDWCVDWDTVLPDGRLVRELRLGDLVECIDVATGEVGMFPLRGMGFGEEECYRLVTPDLCSVVQSRSTPMNLPDGRVLQTPEMFGRPVYAKPNGDVRLSFVADLEYVGLRRVCKPDLGDRMFFAGERADATIATHNVQYKP